MDFYYMAGTLLANIYVLRAQSAQSWKIGKSDVVLGIPLIPSTDLIVKGER